MQKLCLFILGCILSFNALSFTTNKTDKLKIKDSLSAKIDSMDWIIDELIVKWTNNKIYTIEVIELMPKEDFDFVPAEDMMSFKKQTAHIVTTLHWQMKKLGFDEIPDFDDASKESILASYDALFSYIDSELRAMKGDQLSENVKVFYGDSSKRRLLNLMDNHVAHHRGQLIVYLRLKGIKPPSYKGW